MAGYTSDPVRDAEVYYLFQDKQAEELQEMIEENYNDFSFFQDFLHDLDFNDPEWRLMFDQREGDITDKVYAFDQIMLLFREYVEDLTE